MAFRLSFWNSRSGKWKGYVDDEIYDSEEEAESALQEAEENFAAGADVMEALGERPSKNIVIEIDEV